MGRLKPISKITLKHLLFEPEKYASLADTLSQLSAPDTIRFKKLYQVPDTLESFSSNICYGQRLYLTISETTDVGIILRYIAGYYYTQVNGVWNEKEALKFGSEVLPMRAVDVYPIAIRLIELMGQLAERERKLLHREPSADERAAGIESLNKYSELTSLIFLTEQFKCTDAEVLLKPYDDCLVRFMLAKDQNAFQQRLIELKK